jgi:predicted ester cyclase
MSSSLIGPEVYKCEVLKLLKAFPDIRMTIEDIVGEHEKIVVVWTFSGTHGGEFMGIPATRKKVSVDGVTIHHVADGKVIDSLANWDLLGIFSVSAQSWPGATTSGRPLCPRQLSVVNYRWILHAFY